MRFNSRGIDLTLRGTVPFKSERSNTFNLYLYIFGEAGHFNATSRRASLAEHLGINTVKRYKVIHILDEYCGLNNIGKRRPSSFKNILQVCYYLTSLIFNGNSFDGISRRIDRNLTRAENKTAYFKSLTIRTERLRRIFR